jgi:hypothetical protein
MTNVTITYRPFLFPFAFKFKREVPAGWSEVGENLMLVVTKYYNRKASEDALICELFGIKKWIVKRLAGYYKYKLFELFLFIKELNATRDFVIKEIGELRSPKSGLKGLPFGHFIYGDTFFSDYMRDGGEENLNRFIAAFYGGKDFDEDNLDALLDEIKKTCLEKREAVAVNYIMVKKWITEKYKYVFRKPEVEDEKDKKVPAILRKQKVIGGWVNIFDAMVGDDIVNREKYLELPVNEALRYLDNRIRKNMINGH